MTTNSIEDVIEMCKFNAARAAVDDYIRVSHQIKTASHRHRMPTPVTDPVILNTDRLCDRNW